MPTFFVLATVYDKRAATSAIYFKCLISNFMPERVSYPFRFFILVLIISFLHGCKQRNDTMEQAPAETSEWQVQSGELFSYLEPPALDSSYFTFRDGFIALDWKILSHVTFEEKYSEEVESFLLYPQFAQIVQMLDNELVEISGYVIPLDEVGQDRLLVLSAFPYTQCFFCGNAGPESIMEIKLKGKAPRLRMDQQITFRGRLKLNDTDVYSLNYILENACLHN